MHLLSEDIKNLDKIYRLNLINSVTGIKPANLIGSVSSDGYENLAIFSSAIHLGSNPPLIGLITRPVGEVPRHTYENIMDTGMYTINSVKVQHTEEAHFTSAKFDKSQSEFEYCGFKPSYINDFRAPFVNESPLKLGISLVEEVHIKQNGTILLIGEIKHLIIQDDAVDVEGHIQMEKLGLAGVSGLNSYYSLKKEGVYPYARIIGGSSK